VVEIMKKDLIEEVSGDVEKDGASVAV